MKGLETLQGGVGWGAGGLVSNAARVLLTHLACDLLLRAVSVERRSRSWCLNDSDVDGPRPCGISVVCYASASRRIVACREPTRRAKLGHSEVPLQRRGEGLGFGSTR